LKCYCNYLVVEEYLEENPINKIVKRKEPQQLPKALTKDQIGELLNSLDVAFDKNIFTGLRNITMVYAYLHTGLRLSELTSLRLENIKLIDGYIKVIK
jgi:integrase/recombinase XerD